MKTASLDLNRAEIALIQTALKMHGDFSARYGGATKVDCERLSAKLRKLLDDADTPATNKTQSPM